jgi:hypothetical protein
MKKVFILPMAVLCLAATAHAAGTVDASNSTITCASLTKAGIKLKPALVNGGLLPTTVSIKGALSGCTTNAPGVTSISGSFKGTLTGGTNSCAGLLGPTTNTGTIAIKWKATPGLIDSTSTVQINSGAAVGGLFAGLPPGAYGQFQLGSPPGAALSVTGSFTGGDGGATSTATVITTQDAIALAGLCATTNGVKALNIGIGVLTLQ